MFFNIHLIITNNVYEIVSERLSHAQPKVFQFNRLKHDRSPVPDDPMHTIPDSAIPVIAFEEVPTS